MNDQTQSTSSQLKEAIIVGSLVAGVLGFAVAKEMGFIDAPLAKRAIGIILGGILILMGNFLPKIVRPLSAHHSDPLRIVRAERFAGRVFVLAGVAYIAAWVFGPQQSAILISSIIGLGAFVLAAGNWARVMRSEMFNDTDAGKLDKFRDGRFHILFAIFWVFGIFLADYFWGDWVSQPMAIGYVFALVVWAVLKATKARLSK